MSSLTLDGAGRWAEVPQLPPEVERAAARALVDFLREVEKAVLEGRRARSPRGASPRLGLQELRPRLAALHPADARQR